MKKPNNLKWATAAFILLFFGALPPLEASKDNNPGDNFDEEKTISLQISNLFDEKRSAAAEEALISLGKSAADALTAKIKESKDQTEVKILEEVLEKVRWTPALKKLESFLKDESFVPGKSLSEEVKGDALKNMQKFFPECHLSIVKGEYKPEFVKSKGDGNKALRRVFMILPCDAELHNVYDWAHLVALAKNQGVKLRGKEDVLLFLTGGTEEFGFFAGGDVEEDGKGGWKILALYSGRQGGRVTALLNLDKDGVPQSISPALED